MGPGPDVEFGIKIRNSQNVAKALVLILTALSGSVGGGVYVKSTLDPKFTELQEADAAHVRALASAEAKAVALSQQLGVHMGALRVMRCRENVLGNVARRQGYDPGWTLNDVEWEPGPRKPKSAPEWVADDDDECDKLPPLEESKP